MFIQEVGEQQAVLGGELDPDLMPAEETRQPVVEPYKGNIPGRYDPHFFRRAGCPNPGYLASHCSKRGLSR